LRRRRRRDQGRKRGVGERRGREGGEEASEKKRMIEGREGDE